MLKKFEKKFLASLKLKLSIKKSKSLIKLTMLLIGLKNSMK